jgi:hypothetical protein
VGKTANSLLKDGAKIHLKNDRKSKEERAENPEWKSAKCSLSRTENPATYKTSKVSCQEQFTAPVLVDER